MTQPGAPTSPKQFMENLRAGDKSKKGPADATHVNIRERYEVEYWTSKFGCTEQQLQDCVKRVGVTAMDVEKCLGK
jgi:hypothetical protein